MCQVCNAQPGPFFCRDQVRPVLLQPVLWGFLEKEQALLLGFGDIYTGSSPVGKMRWASAGRVTMFWRRCSPPGEGDAGACQEVQAGNVQLALSHGCCSLLVLWQHWHLVWE